MRARQLARQAANPTDQIVAHTLGFRSSAVNLSRIFFELGPEQSRARSGEAYGGGYPGVLILVLPGPLARSAAVCRKSFFFSSLPIRKGLILPFLEGRQPLSWVVSILFSVSYSQDRRSYYLFFTTCSLLLVWVCGLDVFGRGGVCGLDVF